MTHLAIVCPCYNEEAVLRISATRLTALLERLQASGLISAQSYVLWVNDGSRDSTWQIIQELCQDYPHFSGLNLASNVGHQSAIMAGMMTAMDACDALVTVDADLQDDIDAIEHMLAELHRGADIVYGVKVNRTADPLAKRLTAQAFYKLQQAMGIDCVYNHADFRLMSQRAVQALSQYGERNLYLRGLIPKLGFPTAQVDDVISERLAGQSKYSVSKMLVLAMDGITSFTTRPLEWITLAGFASLFVSLGVFVYVLYSLIRHQTVAGWTSIMLSLWLIGAMMLLAIGIVGQYIGKIYIEVKNRPRYHIAQHIPAHTHQPNH